MIKASFWEVRMASDDENGNGLRYECLKKYQAVSFSKAGFEILLK